MRSANSSASRALRGCLAAIVACASIAPAFAGGPLYVVPVGGVMKPLHWVGTVHVYPDSGNLNVGDGCAQYDENWNCVVEHPVLNQDAGDALVAATVAQWSGVPTSSFRAVLDTSHRAPVDITGTNYTDYIGKTPNGGGIQTIYDADNSVIMEITGGDGYGVLGIASPEYTSAQDPTQIIEAWQIIGGSFLNATSTDQISGVVTHEFGHAINLAHTQTNGFYSSNNPIAWSRYAGGPEQAGPDQCGVVASYPTYPTANQIETMYPMIDPWPLSPTYNSPQMAIVQDDADDMAALSSIYPAPGYAVTTGTLQGRVVAKDGTNQLTGVNVIARRIDRGQPLSGAISRISGDATQGLLGADGNFTMTGLVPGASYVVYIDQLRAGAFSTPKALLLGPEEYWNSGESGDASVDNACTSTPITLGAGETRQITMAVNGIPRAPTFTQIPYVLATEVSDNGQQVAGIYWPDNDSPYWLWDKSIYRKLGDVQNLGGHGANLGLSGNGRVIGGSVPAGPEVETWSGPVKQERAALWTKESGWKTITNDNWPGCGIFHTSVFDLSTNGSTAVGLAFQDCAHVYGYKWTAKTGMTLLSKVGESDARANAVSGDGRVVAGWQTAPDQSRDRVGSIWQGKEQMLLRDQPHSVTPGNPNGWVGEVGAINSAGTVAVGFEAGPDANDSYMWSTTSGVRNLGGDKTPVCYMKWFDDPTGQGGDPIRQWYCGTRKTVAYSISDDAKVIAGDSTYFDGLEGVTATDGAIYTPQLGWMQLSKFLQSQGVLEATNWVFLGSIISANGKTLIGTAFPLASDYYQGYRVDLDQVYVCQGKGKAAKTLRVGFPDAMDQQLAAGATVGLCPGDAPL